MAWMYDEIAPMLLADAPQLLDEQARVPGLAPWLQEAPVAAQVHARYLRDIRRQLELASDERDFRIEHEVPALQAGRAVVLANLQRAQREAAAAQDAGRATVLQRASQRAEALRKADALVLAGLPSVAGIPDPGGRQGGNTDLCSDDGASAASGDEGVLDWIDTADDIRSAMQQHDRDEAEAAAAAPFEPIQQDDGDFAVASSARAPSAAAEHASVTATHARAGDSTPAASGDNAAEQPPDSSTGDDSCSQDVVIISARPGTPRVVRIQNGEHSWDLFADANGMQQLQVVETVAEANLRENRSSVLVVLTEVGVTAQLTGEDFRALASDQQLTTPVLDLVSVMLQV